jgi:hypothetical protein
MYGFIHTKSSQRNSPNRHRSVGAVSFRMINIENVEQFFQTGAGNISLIYFIVKIAAYFCAAVVPLQVF